MLSLGKSPGRVAKLGGVLRQPETPTATASVVGGSSGRGGLSARVPPLLSGWRTPQAGPTAPMKIERTSSDGRRWGLHGRKTVGTRSSPLAVPRTELERVGGNGRGHAREQGRSAGKSIDAGIMAGRPGSSLEPPGVLGGFKVDKLDVPLRKRRGPMHGHHPVVDPGGVVVEQGHAPTG